MTLDELKAAVADRQAKGHSWLTLVIPRKGPPESDFARVKGLGKGRVLNAIQNADGTWQVVAQFAVAHIAATFAKERP